MSWFPNLSCVCSTRMTGISPKEIARSILGFANLWAIHGMPRHVTSCYVMSYHVTSCHFMSCHGMSFDIMSRHVISCHVMSCHFTSCHGMSCHVTSCHVMPCHVMSCYVISYPVTSSHFMFLLWVCHSKLWFMFCQWISHVKFSLWRLCILYAMSILCSPIHDSQIQSFTPT